jgi:predicted N-acetyltransferase YhbS
LLQLLPLLDVDWIAREAMLDAAFGRDRRRLTSYRLREGTTPVGALSFAAYADGMLAGSVQASPVALRHASGVVPRTQVGPVAVQPEPQGQGNGTRLMQTVLAAADGGDPLVLIGDPEYYGRFGFVAAPTTGWVLPGPVERRRLLVRASAALPTEGELGPRP